MMSRIDEDSERDSVDCLSGVLSSANIEKRRAVNGVSSIGRAQACKSLSTCSALIAFAIFDY